MRASGKTFRAILRALADASEGKQVIYVQGVPCRSYFWEWVDHIVQGLHGCTWFSHAQSRLEFRSDDGKTINGTLTLVSEDIFIQQVRACKLHGLAPRSVKIYRDDPRRPFPPEVEDFLRIKEFVCVYA